MLNLEWSKWSSEEYPSCTCEFNGYTARVRAVDVSRENGYNNRQWTVKNRDGVVIGTGYVLSSSNAQKMVEATLYVTGVLAVSKIIQRIETYPVRQG